MANSGLLRAGERVPAAGQVLDRRSLAGRLLDRPLVAGSVGELGGVLEEDEADCPDGSVSVLSDDQFGAAGGLGLRVVVVVAVEKADDVGVLLACAGPRGGGEDRPLVRRLLGARES